MSDERETRSQSENQGEGNREAAQRYNRDTRAFVESGRVAEAVDQAAEQDPSEAEQAEQAGRERAREEDPALERDYRKPVAGG